MTVQELIPYLSTFSPLVVLALGFKKRIPLLWLYALAGFISDVLLVIVFPKEPIRFFVVNIFVIVEFLCIYGYYRTKLKEHFNWVLIIGLCVFIATLVKLFHSPDKGFALNHAFDFNWIGATVLCIVYIGFAFCGFLKITRQQTIIHLERSSFFTINTAFIIYYSTVFLVLLFSQYLVSRSEIPLFWNFLEVMNIIKYLLLARALTLKNP